MPTIKSAAKRLRQSEKRRRRNRPLRSRIRTEIRNLLALEDPAEARPRLEALYSLLDRAAGRGILHPNKAAREKSRLARHVRRLEGEG